MIQKELNEENKEIKDLAYELYAKHGFKNGNDYVDWLEAERLAAGHHTKVIPKRHMPKVLWIIVGILLLIVAILLMLLFQPKPKLELSQKSLSDLKLMMVVLDPKPDEEVAVFGDTYFDFNQATLSLKAQSLLDLKFRSLTLRSSGTPQKRGAP